MLGRLSGAVAVGILFVVGGCIAPESSEVDDELEADELEADEELLTSTVVEIGEDGGVRVVAVEQLSKEQMRQQIEARIRLLDAVASGADEEVGAAQAALSRDTACDTHSLWLYDKYFDANWNNTGNRLCIKGPTNGGDGGGAYANICRARMLVAGGGPGPCAKWWGGAVRAYWSGDDAGFFVGNPSVCGGVYGVEVFDWYQRKNAGACAQMANELHFGPYIY